MVKKAPTTCSLFSARHEMLGIHRQHLHRATNGMKQKAEAKRTNRYKFGISNFIDLCLCFFYGAQRK